MTDQNLVALLASLTQLPRETEWVEFKVNDSEPEEIGEYLCALANSAALHQKDAAYIVWGVEDRTHRVVGTSFKPRDAKVGNEEIENWLTRLLSPRIEFKIHEFSHDGNPVVIFQIRPCRHTPVRFRETEFIRIGTYKKKLKDYPEKERALWFQIAKVPFEREPAATDLTSDEVLARIDYPSYFELSSQNLPADKASILERLQREKLISNQHADRWSVTSLGAMLFAKRMTDFETVARKAVRESRFRTGASNTSYELSSR